MNFLVYQDSELEGSTQRACRGLRFLVYKDLRFLVNQKLESEGLHCPV